MFCEYPLSIYWGLIATSKQCNKFHRCFKAFAKPADSSVSCKARNEWDFLLLFYLPPLTALHTVKNMQEITSFVNVCGSDCEMEMTPHGVSMPLQSSGTSAASFPKASIPSRCDFLLPETLKTSQICSVIYTFPVDWESLQSETFSGGTSVKCTFSVHTACLIHMYMLLPCPLITSFFLASWFCVA